MMVDFLTVGIIYAFGNLGANRRIFHNKDIKFRRSRSGHKGG